MEEQLKIGNLTLYDLPEVDVSTRRLSPGSCFFFPDDVAESLLITDVKVGKNSQLYSSACVPASLFAESAPDVAVLMDRLPAGMNIRMSVTNASDSPVAFRGQVAGVAGDPRGLLDDLEVASLTTERYLNQASSSGVPARQLTRENLAAGGPVRLEPDPWVAREIFFTVEVVNRGDRARNFCGVVLAYTK